jgi:hypothetical protein
MQNSFRTFKIPILYIDEKSASKLDIYRYIIKSLYENYKKTDNYETGVTAAIGLGAQEFLANLMYNGDDAVLAYQDCLNKGYLKRHNHPGVKKDITNTIYGVLLRCCKSEEELPVALYSSFKSMGKIFQLTPTPLYYAIKDFVNSLEGDEFIISNELVIVPKK